MKTFHPERPWRVPSRPPAPPSGAWLARAQRLLGCLLHGLPDLRGNPDSSPAACHGWDMARFQANASMTPTATGPIVATNPVRPRFAP